MGLVIVFMGTMMEWHLRHMTETMTDTVVATVLTHTLLDGGTIPVSVHI